MATWHRLEPADASFFASAPQLHRFLIDVDVSPERVWESLASDESIAAWPLGRGLSVGLRWTSARPFGVDATREVTLPLGLATVRERFFRWDEGRGYSFFAEQINRPGFRRFAEDYAIEPRGTGARLTWIVAIEPDAHGARLGAVTRPLNRLAFGRTAHAGRKYFAQHP